MTAANPASALRRIIVSRSTALVTVLSLLIALISTIIGVRVSGDAKTVWLAIGTSLFATVVFSLLQVLLTADHQDALIRETINESLDQLGPQVDQKLADVTNGLSGSVREVVEATSSKTVIDLTKAVNETVAEHRPLEIYRPMDHEDLRFNRDLNESMLRSSKYVFRGFTARYSIARLANLNSSGASFDDIRLLVVHPNTPKSVERRQGNSEWPGRGVHANVVEEVWLSIVGALKVRPKCGRIEFCFVADPPNDRYEIFDDEIYVSYFTDRRSKDLPFPLTEKHGRESREYQRQLADVNSLFNSTYTDKLEIPQDESVEELILGLRAIGLALDLDRYNSLSAKFEEFIRDHAIASSALPNRPRILDSSPEQ